MSNPFYVSGPVPPEYFVGRKSEVNILFDLVVKRSHGAFFGSPGMGKSSLLKLLTYPQVWRDRGQNSDPYFIIYLNCTSINPFTSRGFWEEVLNLLREEAEAEEELQNAIAEVLQEEEIDRSNLRRILRQVGKCGKYLLLLLDDYDTALRPNDRYTESEMLAFLSEFRNLAVHGKTCQYLSTIVTTFRRLSELGPKILPNGSPWYNHYLFHPIKPYREDEVKTAFFDGSSKYLMPIKSNLHEGVVRITGGHPALLQNAGYLLYDMEREGQEINIPSFTKDFQSRTEQVFRDIWRFSTEEEQVLLMLIALSKLEGLLEDKKYALEGTARIFSQRGRELIDLEERGVIKEIRENDDSIYRFNSSLMEWWVIREIENSDEEELKKREKIFLKLISREQWSQVQKVASFIWEKRETVKKIWNLV
ncbi:MAG: AAA family ATPase, partial [Cyanobacteria bacterium P01_E01_bin.42]